MCQKAADASLSSLKFVSNWLFTLKMFEDLDNAVSFNNDMDFNPISTGGEVQCTTGVYFCPERLNSQ